MSVGSEKESPAERTSRVVERHHFDKIRINALAVGSAYTTVTDNFCAASVSGELLTQSARLSRSPQVPAWRLSSQPIDASKSRKTPVRILVTGGAGCIGSNFVRRTYGPYHFPEKVITLSLRTSSTT
ncbi:hypothetical protein FB451DRAFT_1178024 [Mycena latifolia]|nr:hypothetical protein FB451DRAFT_1178024 [Mycena latifolia]